MKLLFSAIVALGLAARAGAACTPTVQWIWDGPTQGGGYPDACTTPLVLELTDDNGDGRIDTSDTPDVVLLHQSSATYQALLTALDGATGTEHWTSSTVLVMPTALAAGDLDGDGLVDILAVAADGLHLVAFDHTGTLLWTSDPSPVQLYEFSALSIADLDQDGLPEIFSGATVWGADGALRWSGSAGRGVEGHWNLITITNAADLDPASPGLELLAGNTLYDAQGRVLWQNTLLPDGFTAIGDLDGDGQPEIALATNDQLWLLDARGNALGTPWSVPGQVMSQPVIADLDGDGLPEVVGINDYIVDAVDWDGSAWSRKWSAVTTDDTRLNGASAYDFDGDGAAELIYHDSFRWYIFDGRTGVATSTLDFISATTIEVPVVADLDHDCVPEILVSGCQGGIPYVSPNQVIAYECAGGRAARPMWNEYGYHVTNVNDDGSIPRVEANHWTAANSWQQQVGGGGPAAIPGPPIAVCLGSPARLDGSLSQGCPAGYEYRFRDGLSTACDWSAMATCNVTPPTSPRTYTMDVRCAGQPGCEASAAITVTSVSPPTARAGADASVCERTPLTLDGGASTAPGCSGGLIYEWRLGTTVVRAAGPSPTWAPPTTPPGTTIYTLATWCASGPRCEATDTVSVEIRSCPLSVAFESYAARPAGAGVEVTWRTLSEQGTLCFSIEQAVSSAGPWAPAGDCVEARGALSGYRLALASSSPWYRIVEQTLGGRGDASPAFALEASSSGGARGRHTSRSR